MMLGCVLLIAGEVGGQSLDRVQAGVYGDYFRLQQTKSNFAGIGGRVSVGVLRHLRLECEMAYDFNQVVTQSLTGSSGTIVLQQSNMHLLHGEFGPKLELTDTRIRPFLVAKFGFDKFFLDACPSGFSCLSSAIQNLHASSVNRAFYPGGGLEGHLGPVGLRLDLGDQMYINQEAHHNLRLAFGPFIRF